MDLISQLFFAVVISSVTGSLLLFVWRLLRKFFLTANPKLINVTLRIVCITYMLPFGYAVILLSEHKWLDGREQGWKLFFARTEWLNILMQLMAIAWFLIACGVTFMRIMQNVAWYRKLEDNIPMEDKLVVDVFNRVCQKMDITKGAVTLRKNPLMVSPMIIKAYHPQIILPEQEYTEEELELIFYHELSHYKNHDLNWKVAVVILTSIQGFNPVIYRLLSIVSFWSECMADVSALEFSNNIHNARPYFEKIENLLPEIEEKKRDKYLIASLFRDNKEMVKRVDFVCCYQHTHICSRQITATTLTVFFLVSILLSSVTGMLISELHKFIYKATTNYNIMQVDSVSEYYVDGKDWTFDEQMTGLLFTKNRMSDMQNSHHIKCTVKPGACQTICNFSAEAGEVIVVDLMTSFSLLDYCLGIQDEEGYVRYVIGNGAIAHIFPVTKKSRCCAFIQNNSVDEAIHDIEINVSVGNACQ